nr:MAG TPA: hypothetical protein [Caudoviricetes sp.]
MHLLFCSFTKDLTVNLPLLPLLTGLNGVHGFFASSPTLSA